MSKRRSSKLKVEYCLRLKPNNIRMVVYIEMTDHSLILKFTSLGEVAIDIPNGYDQINKYNGTMAHKFNHKFYEHNIRQSYVSNKSLVY